MRAPRTSRLKGKASWSARQTIPASRRAPRIVSATVEAGTELYHAVNTSVARAAIAGLVAILLQLVLVGRRVGGVPSTE